jgi:hypothetical protein
MAFDSYALVDGYDMNGTDHIYRMKTSQRVVSIVLLVAGLLFTVGIWWSALTGTREPKFLEMMFPPVFSLVAAIFTWRSFQNMVRLSEDALEFRGPSGMRVLPFDKIKGRRRYLSRGHVDTPDVWHLVLEPNDDRYTKIDLEELYRFDQAFYTWFNGLPDLDEIDKANPKVSNFGLV